MSADNGYIVKRCSDNQELFGVFHYMGETESRYLQSRARRTSVSAIAAILTAHKLENTDHTEYGVHIPNDVIVTANAELQSSDIPQD